MLNKFLNNKGFSLIEMLVVALIFSMVIGVIMGVFTSIIKIQKYNLSHQQLLNQASYAMEYMERSIRMAVKADGSECSFSGDNYRVTSPAGQNTKIEFRNYEGDCQEFYLDSDLLTSYNDEVYSTSLPMISEEYKVTFLRFNVIGEAGPPGDLVQPRVTVVMEIEGKVLGPDPKMRIQTTVSQRNLDI